ncbi:right-handed parallel beta-helix repeat-containing protein [Dyadobacter fermentans]|uniref:Parallel beta-helix repeat protein n=1 Tax=Dyadobacter fermentans (strain ATCC 700827 / DSM 18053 / CIP 107007 / KCTC 52180 / NS114) TaxID=471854 RepID=C6W313_DYAFD|nr:right-handed parallel beta-helix repeat-containing protein [Dyadobacter fermentans]ACT95726.1 Parallel beta-helix repeat protein [Dyadobacter fermentans DSM 18053]
MLKARRILWATLSFALLLGSCKEDEDVTPSDTLTAKAGADQNVNAGSVVTLDGSASTDSENKPFDFSWAFTKKPAGSAANLASATTAKPTFTADVAGDYEVELTISNANGQSKDKVVITAAVIEPIVIDAQIRAKLTLNDRIDNPAIPDYIVNANVSVNAELEIKPGVVIAFARDTRLEINDGGGVLLAKGDSAKPIRFIGKETTKGFWSGVTFRSSSSANTLEYVQVLHAGSKPLFSTTKAGMAVLGSQAEVNIKHCLFEANAGYGLYIQDGVALASFEKNNFKDNTEAGLLLSAENVQNLDTDSKFTNGNGRNVVEITASSLPKNATAEVIWKGFKDKTPYRILEHVTSDANWKLLPGVTIEVNRAGAITIDDGYFNAVGTETNKIIIRGAENAAAYWKGLLSFSTSDQNIIENAEVSGGGNIAIVSGKKANIAIYGGQSRMTIRKSVISNSGGYGIFVNYQATVNDDVETVNTFKDNAQAKLLKE